MLRTPGPRLRAAGFSVTKTLDEFRVAESSIPKPTFDYLAGLEWIRARENLVLVGPAGTGKSHCETDYPVHGWAGSPDWCRQRRG